MGTLHLTISPEITPHPLSKVHSWGLATSVKITSGDNLGSRNPLLWKYLQQEQHTAQCAYHSPWGLSAPSTGEHLRDPQSIPLILQSHAATKEGLELLYQVFHNKDEAQKRLECCAPGHDQPGPPGSCLRAGTSVSYLAWHCLNSAQTQPHSLHD